MIDDEGIIRYIDIHDIDEQPENRVLFDEIKKLRPGYVDEAMIEDSSPLPQGGIVMYCTRWCPECRRARDWLNNQGLQYTEVDVMSSPGADKQVRAWNKGNLVTPTFDIDGHIMTGFDQEKINQILNR